MLHHHTVALWGFFLVLVFQLLCHLHQDQQTTSNLIGCMLLSKSSALRSIRLAGTRRGGAGLAKRAFSSTPNIPPPLYDDSSPPVSSGGMGFGGFQDSNPNATQSSSAPSPLKSAEAKAVLGISQDAPGKPATKIPAPLYTIPNEFYKKRFYGFQFPQRPKESPHLPWPMMDMAHRRHQEQDDDGSLGLGARMLRDPRRSGAKRMLDSILMGVLNRRFDGTAFLGDFKPDGTRKSKAKAEKMESEANLAAATEPQKTSLKARKRNEKKMQAAKVGGPHYARKDYEPTWEIEIGKMLRARRQAARANAANGTEIPVPVAPEPNNPVSADIDYLSAMEEAEVSVDDAEHEEDENNADSALDKTALANAAATEHRDNGIPLANPLAQLQSQELAGEIQAQNEAPTGIRIQVFKEEYDYDSEEVTEGTLKLQLDSVKRKRQTKMNKHKRRKRRRALRHKNENRT